MSEQISPQEIVANISPSIQDSVILARSKKKWESIKEDLVKTISGCSRRDSERIYCLLDRLSELFRRRLNLDISEPRAVMFTISDAGNPVIDELMRIVVIARKARLIYVYRSSGKTAGAREEYFVPNRLLLPERGLDPVGQHARVSIKAIDLWNAADQNKILPEPNRDDSLGEFVQPKLL